MIGISLKNTAKVLLILFSLALFPIFATANVLVSEQYTITPKGSGVGEGTVFSSSNYSIQGGAQTVSSGGEDDVDPDDSGDRSGSGRNRVTAIPNQNIFPEFIVGLKNEPLPSQRKNTLSANDQEVVIHEQSESIETTDSLQEVNTRSVDARDMRFTASAMGAWMSGQLTEVLESFGNLFERRSARAGVLATVIGAIFFLRRTLWGKRNLPF